MATDLSKTYAYPTIFAGDTSRKVFMSHPPPSAPLEPALEFLIGRDNRGHWLAIETRGLAGGYFASAREAIRFVSGDFPTRAKRIELVDDMLDPFDRTCVEIASRSRHATRPTSGVVAKAAA